MPSAAVVLVNDKAEIRRIGELAERFGAEQHLSDDDVMAINLVLDELVTNIIEYGYDDDGRHEIRVSLTLEEGTLTVVIDDDARPFDPLQRPAPDLTLPLDERPVGGLGIHIVRSVMDTVDYERRDGHNVLTMCKTIGRS